MQTYLLKHNIVRHVVPRGRVGFYRLGAVRHGRFIPKYFGRSDTDLRRRLLQHVKTRKETHFRFEETETLYRAFVLECCEWHLPQPYVTNVLHPDAPNGIAYECPYCAFGRSDAVAAAVSAWGSVL